MRRSIHREAERDVLDAVRFYRREGGVRLARRFLDEFERVVRLLEQEPALGTPRSDGRRAFPLSHFPYSLIYRAQDEQLRVFVVRHQSRDPAHGDDRA